MSMRDKTHINAILHLLTKTYWKLILKIRKNTLSLKFGMKTDFKMPYNVYLYKYVQSVKN